MDGNRFDALARSLAVRPTRRNLVGAVVGAIAAGLTGSRAGAAGRMPGESCRKNTDCASKICVSDATGRGRCQCGTAADCPTPSNKCMTVACVAGACQQSARTGQACDDRNACTVNTTCTAQGRCEGQAITCTATDQCHDAGVCDPMTGTCSNPAKPNGTPCSDANACTEGDACQNGVCQSGTPKVCPVCQACSNGTCQPVATDTRCSGACSGGECCKGERASCSATSECCSPMTCRGGLCLFDCPLGGFPCGATCCASFEHCQNGTSCDCIPVRGQCNPANNLCCQNGETLCPASNPYGNANTCCKPQGGTCSSGADCCFEVYDSFNGNDTCGTDGVCGGAGAYCRTAEECVDGRSCYGACFGKGLGFVLCQSDSECPEDVDGNATSCRQRRCIYQNELPA